MSRPLAGVRSVMLALAACALVAAAGCGGDDGPRVRTSALPPLTVTSPAFVAGGSIAIGYTCSGANQSPALHWEGRPATAVAFALIVDDSDAGGFTHWLVYDIPAATNELAPAVSPGGSLPVGAKEGKNSFGSSAYGGPCPPKGTSPHHYHFAVYALDRTTGLRPGASKGEVVKAMEGHIVASGELVGTFGR